LCPQAGLHFVANDWSILGHDLVPRMYGLLNEGGMVYSQAHAAVLTHMLPLKTEESTFVVTSDNVESSRRREVRV